MTERPFDISKYGRDMTDTTAGKNRIFQWPGTGSWTLMPIQFTPDYVNTSYWEALKFRLSDCTYDPGWWIEAPEGFDSEGNKYDWFLHLSVTSGNISSNENALANMPPYITFPSVQDLLLQSQTGNGVIASINTLPINQGYFLRFFIEGRSTNQIAAYMDFWFGQFVLRLNTNGQALLWQAMNPSSGGSAYAYVKTFTWCDSAQVHDRYHAISIQPHARNKLEITTSTGKQYRSYAADDHTAGYGPEGASANGVYTLPGIIPVTSSGWPIITQAARWAMRCSTKYIQHIQVGLTAFYNGNAGTPSLYDTVVNPDFLCNQNISFAADYDEAPNTQNYHNVINPDTGNTWTPPAQAMQYWFSFSGDNSYTSADGVNGSSVTPEFYGYSITKGAGYTVPAFDTMTTQGLEFKMDLGETPEAERLVVTLDNSAGQVDAFSSRGQVGMLVTDPQIIDTTAPAAIRSQGITLFEGVGYGQTCPESPGDKKLVSLTLPCRGMVDFMVRCKWGGHNPDFGNDPKMPGKGWLAGDVIRRCFAQGGFDSSQVVVEEESTYLSQFRLWMGQQAGGPVANNHPSDGHEVQGIHSQWQPSGETAANEFLDWFVRDILGWTWHRNKRDRLWHVYRRPSPVNTTDVELGKFIPKAAFYKSQVSYSNAPNTYPNYMHSHMEMGPIKRPQYTTVEVETVRPSYPTTHELGVLIQQAIQNNAQPENAVWDVKNRIVYYPFDNPAGYVNSQNNPPNLDSPDFIGIQTVQKIPTSVIGLNNAALAWVGRRIFEDNCYGYIPFQFEADWGDLNLYNLRKYDVVLVETRKFGLIPCTIDRIEPMWNAHTGGRKIGWSPKNPNNVGTNQVRRAKYKVYMLRYNCPPPR